MNITSDTLLRFNVHDGKTYLDGKWNRKILITEALLANTSGSQIEINFDIIHIRVMGAIAVYRLTEPRSENPNHVYEAILIDVTGTALEVPV